MSNWGKNGPLKNKYSLCQDFKRSQCLTLWQSKCGKYQCRRWETFFPLHSRLYKSFYHKYPGRKPKNSFSWSISMSNWGKNGPWKNKYSLHRAFKRSQCLTLWVSEWMGQKNNSLLLLTLLSSQSRRFLQWLKYSKKNLIPELYKVTSSFEDFCLEKSYSRINKGKRSRFKVPSNDLGCWTGGGSKKI